MAFARARLIDLLPPNDKQRVIDMLIARTPCREVSTWISQHCTKPDGTAYTISHTQVAAYFREVLAPALRTGAKLQQLKRANDAALLNALDTASLTHSVLAADPLLQRQLAKYARYDQIIPQAIKDKDFAAFASIDKAETMAMRFEAELTGRLQSATTGVQVQIVIGDNRGNAQQNDENLGVTETSQTPTITISSSRE